VTNISADHLGEYGIHDLESLAEVKLMITRVVGPGGRVVLNADDPVLAAAAGQVAAPILWFSLDPANPKVRESLEAGGEAVVLEDGAVVLARGDQRETVGRAEEIPITFGGAAPWPCPPPRSPAWRPCRPPLARLPRVPGTTWQTC
jgi:cyanophycin synthetase